MLSAKHSIVREYSRLVIGRGVKNARLGGGAYMRAGISYASKGIKAHAFSITGSEIARCDSQYRFSGRGLTLELASETLCKGTRLAQNRLESMG